MSEISMMTSPSEAIRIRSIAGGGISIGLPRVARSGNFPHMELEVRRESLPAEESLRFLLAQTRGTIIWQVRIDEQHEARSLMGDDLAFFVRMLEESDAARHVLVFGFDHTATYNAKRLDEIESIRDSVSSVPIFLDTEHASWKSARVQSILTSLKLPHVFWDAPVLPGIVKDAVYNAGSIALLRCLGRNSRTWFEANAEERFHYEYSELELRTIAGRVLALKDEYERVFITFCNRPASAAMQNALQLSTMVG